MNLKRLPDHVRKSFLHFSGGAAVGDAGFGGDVFQGQQLRHGDEHVPLLLEMGNGLEGGVYGVEIAVVEKDDVAVAGASVDDIENFIAVLRAPASVSTDQLTRGTVSLAASSSVSRP